MQDPRPLPPLSPQVGLAREPPRKSRPSCKRALRQSCRSRIPLANPLAIGTRVGSVILRRSRRISYSVASTRDASLPLSMTHTDFLDPNAWQGNVLELRIGF